MLMLVTGAGMLAHSNRSVHCPDMHDKALSRELVSAQVRPEACTDSVSGYLIRM